MPMFDCSVAREGEVLRVSFAGELSGADAAALRARMRALPRGADRLVLDFAAVEAMEGIAAGALAGALAEWGVDVARVEIAATSPAAQPYLREFELDRLRGLAGYRIDRVPAAASIAGWPLRVMASVVDFTDFLRESLRWLVFAPLAGRGFKITPMIEQIRTIGVEGLSIVLPLGFIMGAVIGAIGGIQLERFGAKIYVADLVAIAIPMVIGPMITAILVAGRSGSSIAAEIGTMVVNEEVDALRAMGYHPGKYISAPRLLALILTLPMLTVLADLAGLLGGAAIGLFQLDFQPVMWLRETARALKLSDTYFGLFKSEVYAVVIGLVSVHAGLRVERSAEGVGRAARGAVVTTISALIVLEGVMDVVYSILKSRIAFLAQN